LRTQKRLTQAWDYTGSPSDFSTWGLMDTSYIVEVVDRFNALWGQNTMVQVADAMGDTISKTVNTFASTTQGAIVENYNFEQRYTHWGCNPGSHCSVTLHHNTVCILRKYPVVMTQQTSYSKGASVLTENLKFDEVSGQTTLSRVTSPNKGVNVNKTVPAFRVSNYSSMGPKSVNSSNTNMVSANSASRVTVDSTITASSDFGAYHIGVFGSTFNQRQYVSGSTDFENVSVTLPYEKGIKSYVWAGNQASLDNYGLYKTSDFVAFDYTLAAIDPKWRFSQEQTLFDPIGHALETKGYNNRYNAVKFGYRNQYPIAQAGNSNFASFTYSGFEDQYDVSPPSHVYYTGGEVKMNGGLQILSAGSGAITPHTGDSLVQVSAGATGPSFSVKYLGTSAENVGLQKDRIYRASVWIHSASPADATVSLTYAGGTPVTMRRDDAKGIVIGNWIQLNVDITVPYTAATNDLLVVSLNPGSGSTSYFDDMRLQSTDAVVTSSVYDHKTGWLTATLDANNFATKYVRDAGGKVFEVWQEIQGSGFKKVKKYSYNYGRGL
jgi:hypothetical protein